MRAEPRGSVKIWRKNFSTTDWSKVELLDWIEGAGLVDSVYIRDLVRNIGGTLSRGVCAREGEFICSVCGQRLANR